jgi:hypothetical protein
MEKLLISHKCQDLLIKPLHAGSFENLFNPFWPSNQLERLLPASKGEVERGIDEQNLINNEQNLVINQLVMQVNALTPVSGIPSAFLCLEQHNA